jgi:sugar lactone lactonase YvrE
MRPFHTWGSLAIVISACIGPCAFGLDGSALLNVNFTAALSPNYRIKVGPAAVGAAPGDFWNVYSRDIDSAFNWRESGQVSNLLWADGSPSLSDLTVTNAAGAWGTDSADPMFQIYLYPLSRSGNIQVTLTKVPPGSYDVYVYAHGQPDGENGLIDLSSGPRSYGSKRTSRLPGWDNPAWVEGGQYVLFRGVQVYSSQPLVIQSEPGSTGLAVINGLQLVRLTDGIPDSWRLGYFGPGFANDPRAAATADPDGDGANNFQEFLAGTNPLDAQSVPSVPISVSTFAGSDPGSQDGYRTTATFVTPSSVTFDAKGHLWITEATLLGFGQSASGAHRVRVMDANQVVHTVAGGTEPGLVDGPGSIARFSGPHKTAFDHSGNAFVADEANHRIRKIDPTGLVTTFAGSQAGFADGIGTNAQFHSPICIVSDAADNLYVADFENLRIRKIKPDGTVTTYAGGVRGAADGPVAQASFNSPNGLAFGPDGGLFVSDWSNGSIRRIKDGVVSTFAIGPPYIDGINCDAQGNVYTAFNAAHYLAKYGPDGSLRWTIPTGQGFADGPVSVAKFSTAVGAPLPAPDGSLLAYDVFNNRIRQITIGVPPLLSLSAETNFVTGSVILTLTSSVTNATLHYSLDGSLPTAESPVYAESLQVTPPATLQARLFVNGIAVSDILSASFSGGDNSQPLIFTRALPSYYEPGLPFTVQLKAPPGLVTSLVFAVQDTPPPGWVVSSISDGGQDDPVQHEVKFGPFFDGAAHDLSYQVTPPLGESGPKTFQGAVSTAGESVPIAGAATILPPPYHPADIHPADNRITIDEITAYANAWHDGLSWSVPPNPIPVAYVTRAGLLWKEGESYGFDPGLPPPLCWVRTLGVGPMSLPKAALSSSLATQQLPSAFVAGEPFTAQVLVRPAPSVTSYAVEVLVPVGVTIASINQGGSYDLRTRALRWGPYFDGLQRELIFNATVPSPQSTTLNFSGLASFDGMDQPILGSGLVRAAVRLSGLKLLSQGGFGMSIAPADGKAYQIESSKDLRIWEPLSVVTNFDGMLRFSDPEAAHAPLNFYRATGERSVAIKRGGS